jgi:tRNA pseudouridine32 synthase/23S rRNA pseudouridine746 synthase
MKLEDYFFKLENLPDDLILPEKIDYPHFYSPHPVALIAAEKVQKELETKSFNHDFGINNFERNGAIGKMFGVLVARSNKGELGYFKSFSGKLGESNFHEGFVPPVFDLLDENGFFKKEEAYLNQLNERIEILENDKNQKIKEEEFKIFSSQSSQQLSDFRNFLKIEKKKRAEIRQKEIENLQESDYQKLIEKLKKESISQQIEYKKLNKELHQILAEKKGALSIVQNEIELLKKERKEKSISLQNRIFEQYTFINQEKTSKSLLAIFQETIFDKPPAGAGECAAPKLFQFAFMHNFDPICLAEFWWGLPPDSEVRVHKQFYPACRGKCEPILSHMLGASNVELNPLNSQNNPEELEIIFEDEWIVAVNKPAEFLSVPGITLTDSILTRLKTKYPESTGPLLLHRLDMSTSGVLLAAKTSEIHKQLQKQFIDRKIKKVYHAILDGYVDKDSGIIDLPLTLDVLDRPKQKVCFKDGKYTLTKFKVVKRINGKTLIEFYPVTGRTHQLRVHSAHHLGLNCPILGDDLYGRKDNRLFLHAYQLTFYHPFKKKEFTITKVHKFEETL